ncbi:MAG: holin [Atopobium sp.]|uniref:holin n=1 Tax=Atopobium sp. TaxID=1872650 RepID=UPI002A838708|nr:holin [Atopobium sp.]MDY4522517.1 holin [Atopobium sp.]
MTHIKHWAIAAAVRALKTFAQVAVSLIGTGAVGFTDLDWVQIASVAGVAAVTSILTSIAGLPEVSEGASPLKKIEE